MIAVEFDPISVCAVQTWNSPWPGSTRPSSAASLRGISST